MVAHFDAPYLRRQSIVKRSPLCVARNYINLEFWECGSQS